MDKPIKAIIAVVLMVWCVGCAGPVFNTQAIEDEPSLLVGLARYHDEVEAAAIRHDHPVEWTTGDLQAILKRLAIHEGSGLLDSSKPQQAVFSSEDLTHLVPALQQTFNMARPSDWIVFAVWGGSEHTRGLEVTSGGLFLQDQQLHILLANHRERVSSEEDGIQAIRKNPFHALRDVKRNLLFYPPSYVMASRNNWIMSGFESPVSEVILDYQALLVENRPETQIEIEEAAASEIPKIDRITASSNDAELEILQEEISTLKNELSRLKQQMKQQSADPPKTNIP
jgi:hypothetical protein